jgi:cytoskeletal protein RodZ
MTALTNNIGRGQRLGAILKAAREDKHTTLETAARKLNIRLEYLLAIEDGRFDHLPSGLYAKNYLKKYASFVGIPLAEINSWLTENTETTSSENDPFSKKVVQRKEFIVFPKLFRNLLLFLVFLACLLYLAIYFKKVVAAPKLIIYQPVKDLKTTENRLEIKGETEPEAEININGEAILNTDQGKFSTFINLKKGINDITITAKKKYSGEASVLRQILVE